MGVVGDVGVVPPVGGVTMITGSNGFFVAKTSKVAGVCVERDDGAVVLVVPPAAAVGRFSGSVADVVSDPPPLKTRNFASRTTTSTPGDRAQHDQTATFTRTHQFTCAVVEVVSPLELPLAGGVEPCRARWSARASACCPRARPARPS